MAFVEYDDTVVLGINPDATTPLANPFTLSLPLRPVFPFPFAPVFSFPQPSLSSSSPPPPLPPGIVVQPNETMLDALRKGCRRGV